MIKLGTIALISTLLFCATANARTVNVFLKKEHDGEIKNLDFANKSGDEVIFYFVDRVEKIEKDLTDTNKPFLDSVLKTVVNEIGEEKAKELSPDELTKLVSEKLASKDYQNQLRKMAKQISHPLLRHRLKQGSEELTKAKKLKVDLSQLPVIVIGDVHFRNVFDYEDVLKVLHAK